MKRRFLALMLSTLIIFQSLSMVFSPMAMAVINTPNYGWTLGKYDASTKKFIPVNGSEIDVLQWNNMWVRTLGPTIVNVNGSNNGSAITFNDVNSSVENGYPMVGEGQWNLWIDQLKGNADYVNHYLEKWKVLTTQYGNVNFANLSQLVTLCGGGGLGYGYGYVNYQSSEKPYATILADKTAIKVGESVTVTIKGQSNTCYSQFVDMSFAGAGKTFFNDKRFTGPHAEYTQTVTLNTPGTYQFSLIVRDSVWRSTVKKINVAVGDNVLPPSQPEQEPPTNTAPIARFSWPSTCYEGQEVTVKENSTDAEDNIVKWDWDFSGTASLKQYTLAQGGGTVIFSKEGTKDLTLEVTDAGGLTSELTKSITVKKPIPKAVIGYSGLLKENRKVVLNSNSSRTPGGEIDHTRDEWTIVPVSDGTASDIKIGNRGNGTLDTLFKKAGTYRIGLRVYNERYASEWAYKDIVIGPDLAPIPDFAVMSSAFRDPTDSNIATVKIYDRSYSPDDDIISQRVWKYKFDSDNDGDFNDETFVTLDEGNNTNPFLKVDHVGKYLIELTVKESFGQPTIANFITDSDYRTADTTAKAISQKIAEVQNIAPQTYFTARPKNKIDLVFAIGNNADQSKINNLNAYIDTYIKPKLAANNVDYQITIDQTASWGPNIVRNPGFEQQIFANTTAKLQDPITSDYTSISYLNDPSYGNSGAYIPLWIGKWVIGRNANNHRGYNLFDNTTPYAHTGIGSMPARAHFYDNTYNTTVDFTHIYQSYQVLPNGWKPGKKALVSGWFNIADGFRDNNEVDTEGTLRLELNGYDTWGNNIYNSNSIMYSSRVGDGITRKYGTYQTPTSQGFPYKQWVYKSAVTTIPLNCTKLQLSEWMGLPMDGLAIMDMDVLLDDVSVQMESYDKADTILNRATWRTGAKKYYISLTDEQLVDAANLSTLKSNLLSQDINYSALGSSTNIAEALDIIASNGSNGKYFDATNLDLAVNQYGDYLISTLAYNPSEVVKYLLLDESFTSEPFYSDYENDPKLKDAWHYVHQPSFVDNNNGISIYNGQTLSSPVTTLDKYGKYDIYYKAQDNPVNTDNRFACYQLWSNPLPTTIIVHRRPIAYFTVQSGTLNITDSSYDPDFQYQRPDKGVVVRSWQWKKAADSTWITGKPTGITQAGSYDLKLTVEDNYGVWSLPYQLTVNVVDLNRPPNADFTWTPTIIYENDDVTLKNLSTDPDGDTMIYQWTVYNPKGVTKIYTSKDVFLSNVISGSYWVTLTATDSPKGMKDTITKCFHVGALSVTGQVSHTALWNHHRITFNRNQSGTDDEPRGPNVFWAGEAFVLTSRTTDTGASTTKANSVQVKLLNTGEVLNLTSLNPETWSGQMSNTSDQNLPDGVYTFQFKATYSNGTVKTTDVPILISGCWQDYFRYHRIQ